MDARSGSARSDRLNRFDSIAHVYDQWYESPVHRSIDALERAAIGEALPHGMGERLLLDVGCGTGHWHRFFRMAGYRVVGMDISTRMLEVAGARSGPDVSLVRADAHGLPFADLCVDVACSLTTLEFVDDHMAVLCEMFRCLKVGGHLIIGALNAFSFLGVRRKLLRSRIFRGAHFFTPSELKRCLSVLGEPQVRTCAFAPPLRLLLPVSGYMESVGKTLFPGLGQFIVASVEKKDNER